MTITAVVSRDSFAVIAADSSITGITGMREDTAEKVAWHATLPLAFAAGGLSDCYGRKNEKIRVGEMLCEFMSTLSIVESLDQVERELRHAFAGRTFVNTIARTPAAHISMEVAVVSIAGAAEIARFTADVDGWHVFRPRRRSIYGAPRVVHEEIRKWKDKDRDIEGVDDPAKLAERVSDVVFDCCEISTTAGFADCGPPVTVVLVDNQGARLVSRKAER